MRFEISVALKYLIPRWKQLSVAIISLVSTLVVAMVVWLVLVFLSVTEGLEKKWVDELVSINAPLRVAPTDAYYNSYYYQIDNLSSDANYSTKSIGEKLATLQSDPYDITFDSELPESFPLADKNESGQLKDLVKEASGAITSLQKEYSDLKSQEYEVSFGTLQLKLQNGTTQEHSYLSQVSYIASHSLSFSRLSKLLLSPTVEDYDHFLRNSLSSLENFFSHLSVTQLRPSALGYLLPEALYPLSGTIEAIALMQDHIVEKIILPSSKEEISTIKQELIKTKREYEVVTVDFATQLAILAKTEIPLTALPILVTPEARFTSELSKEALSTADDASDLHFFIEAKLQSLTFSGLAPLRDMRLSKATPIQNSKGLAPWLCPGGHCSIPSSGESHGVLISKHFKKNGVLLGDKGSILYTTPSLNAAKEERLPVYVAGFYDPGLFPMGSKLVFVEPSVTARLRSNFAVSDNMLGNGFTLWFDSVAKTDLIKAALEKEFEIRGISPYWKIESFKDYEFAKAILTQLKSDKNLFTLIALIILLVACSNIISMLILLVNDKKREIAILQAMGASSLRIGTIFGICGFTIGLFASGIGILLSIFTLKHLQSLVNFLSFLQGHDAFQTAFYGNELPNELSISALFFVLFATTIISLIAALVPAIKAAKIRPSQMLRSEG